MPIRFQPFHLPHRRTCRIGWGAWFVGLCLPLFPAYATPKVVNLDSGERLLGEVLPQSDEQTVVLQSALLGELRLPRASVLSIEDQVQQQEEEQQEERQDHAQEEAQQQQLAETAPVLATASASDVESALAPDAPASASAAAPLELAAQEAADLGKSLLEEGQRLKAPESWKGDLRLGLTLSSGDQKWTETYVKGVLEVEPEASRSYYRYSGSYSYRESERSDGSSYVSRDQYDLSMIYRLSFWEDWFFQNSAAYRVDHIKGINREIKDSIGVGYQYEISPHMDFLIGGGGGLEDFQTAFDDTRQGLNPILNVFQEFTWQPIARTTLSQKFNYYWNPQQSGQYNYIFTTQLRLRLTDLLGLEFSYDQSFDSDVGNGRPRDDTRWRNALVIYF